MTYLDVLPEFRSGNSIPVERATLTRSRMQEVLSSYADAVRREALEEAAERITTMPPPHHPNLNHAIEIGRGAREAYAHAIRALIP